MADISATQEWSLDTPGNGGVLYRLVNVSTGPQNDTPAPSGDREPDRGWNLDEKTFGQCLWIFGGPIIFVTGVIGNILVLAVMGRRRMHGTSTSFYLRVMALADLLVLITGMIPEWLEHTDLVVFKQLHPATCKLEKFSFYTCADTAVWILMVFTVDRFIAVCFPLNKKDYCLISRARFYALAAFVCAVAKNFHVFWTRGAEYRKDDNNATYLKSNCGRPEPFSNFELFVRPWIAISLVSFIPFAVILVCNVFIIRALLAVRRLHHEQAIASQSDRTLIQMTIMCLSASFAFLVCVAPSIVLLIGRPYWQDTSWYSIVKDINNQLVYVNHSINFFLYCLTGKRFRHELMRMCRCGVYRNYGSGSPISSMAETTVYRVTNSKPGTSPSIRKHARLQYPPKNGATAQVIAKMSAANQRTNAYRPIEGVSLVYRQVEPCIPDGKIQSTEYESAL
ncbi:hypothetical protein LSH36_515g01063 [Paralvinella palmiformis]|uniref:G-protein coupled receptors family 1 profile domain-containing protein n=1 Tax=Paralvinella palmiformis TaxID=53620 RepID=A0AAD9J881_9ANNE|nr:hypothetical protein LSH36_515g01063 [Paralvinella palmiformis]